MRVAEVVPGIHQQASGPAHSVPALCRVLAWQGVDLELHVNEGSKPEDASYRFHAHGKWYWPPRLDWSPAMRRAMRLCAERADIIHSHGLWNMANIYPGWAARRTDCRLVISPRGALSPAALRFSAPKKRIIWTLWQRRVVQQAVCLHATSEAEYVQIRRMHVKAPVTVVPNGIDLPDLSGRPAAGRRRRRLLFLGRITRIKGIDNLLRAWTAVAPEFPDWELHITGCDDRGHLGEMKTLAAELKPERLEFAPAVYGREKSSAFLAADLFVLPSESENFGMAVAEALAHGTPAIVAKGAPWSGLERHGCGWWIDFGVEPLVECLRSALGESPEGLAERGVRGRDWMERDFSWSEIGTKILETYKWLLGEGDVPQCVRTN